MGVTIGVDYSGGSSYNTIAIVIDGGKSDSKAGKAKTSLLSDTIDTFSKTTIDPGSFSFTVAFDPLSSDYAELKSNLTTINSVAPSWQISFPDNGNGSGATTEEFSAHLVGLSPTVKKNDYLIADVELQLTGNLF